VTSSFERINKVRVFNWLAKSECAAKMKTFKDYAFHSASGPAAGILCDLWGTLFNKTIPQFVGSFVLFTLNEQADTRNPKYY